MANEKLRNLVNNLKNIGVLKTPAIIEAFLKIDRADFVPEEIKNLAYFNEALAIGLSQTISQPYTVAFMLELLEPKLGDKIMDIGSGSGWQTALLAHIVSQLMAEKKEVQPLPQAPASPELQRGEQHEVEPLNMGKVYAMERVPELCDFGRSNITKYNFIEKNIVECFCQDASDGLPKTAKKINGFDKIIAAAELEKIPEAWKKQLKIGGRIVAPIKNSIGLFVKKSPKDFEMKEYPGFAFVPFIKE
ncbi:MAG: Protein-L-isoaspartate O-methyltransferase [Parcubacteria group bacterium GW2011_GWB1_41_6]|nr:MAG: Protein-L-isoaspartate O-methyltransferase [Parcubacteria group bacterium GW2011_GWB1_41_6]KKS34452.1 MAG: Protein-L-isoaspartate O-methyltransferase [Parcubacteria group bacterium GW2011_GWC2_42_13]